MTLKFVAQQWRSHIAAPSTVLPRVQRLSAGTFQAAGQTGCHCLPIRAVSRTVSGYGDFIDKLRAFVATNPDKQVLYIGGDTHTPRVDLR
jgi:hypothetical protein